MKYFLLAISVFFLYIIQTTIMPLISIYKIYPSLMLSFAIIIAMQFPLYEGIFTGLLCGFLLDTLSFKYFGFNSFLFVYFSLLINYLYTKFLKVNVVLSALTVFVFCMLYGIIYYFINLLPTGEYRFFEIFIKIILAEAFYTLILTVPIYFITSNVFNKYFQR